MPGAIAKNLRISYRGLSSRLSNAMAIAAELDPKLSSEDLSPEDWQRLFKAWHHWLDTLENGQFQPGWTEDGYTVIGWGAVRSAETVQKLLDGYYQDQRDRQLFGQVQHQLRQKLKGLLTKLRQQRQRL